MSPEAATVSATAEPPAGRPVLEARGISVRFGGVAALTDVTLSVAAGRVTGLIGPNGAGKTTLFNVITGLQRPDRGDVHIDGTDVTGFGPHRRARLGVARTFQRLELFGTLTAADNVRVGLQAARPGNHSIAPVTGRRSGDPALALLARVGVRDVADVQVGALPTGTARLVELARALSIGPRVILLDEPCSGLDDNETESLGTLLTDLAAEGRAVLLVEHDMDLVLKICDVVHVLDFGEVIASGIPLEIRADPIVQAAYLGRMDVPADVEEPDGAAPVAPGLPSDGPGATTAGNGGEP
ncbi:MAG: ABC transporter ATP-binding protein [Acidimicrobiales bacterium]